MVDVSQEGVLKIDDINKALKLEIEFEDYDSIGGYVIIKAESHDSAFIFVI